MNIQNEIERHVRVLCEEIGARPTGSDANRKAVEYAAEELKKSGLAVRLQPFDCMDWHSGGGTLTVNGQAIAVEPAPYSLPCHVRGETVCIDSLELLRETRITGKIAVLSGKLASEPLMPKSFVFWNPEEHREILSLLENGHPLAVLTASLSPEGYIPVIEDGDFEAPCGIFLQKDLAALQGGATAALTLDTCRRPAKGANVIATYGNGGRRICFSAHIDTGPDTPGALDNASGTAVLLALASALAGRDCSRCVEFVLFNGEDYYSTPGEMAYMSAYLSAPQSYAFAFNIDGVGIRNCKTTISFYECPPDLTDQIRELMQGSQDYEEISPWPQGDHTLFAVSGIPAIAVTSAGIFEPAGSVLHTGADVPEQIDSATLAGLVALLLRVL